MKLQTSLLARFLLAPCVLGLLFTAAANAAMVTFTFENSPETNNSVNGTPMAFDSGGTVGTYYPQDGLTLTMVAGFAPAYVNTGSNTYTWDGTTYVASNTNFANHLAISNPSIPGTGDSNHFNPQESWTIKFDQDVIFRLLGADSIESGDLMQVTIGASTFNFTDGSFDAFDDRADPFGGSFVILANTSITFKNSAVYPTLPITGSNPGAGASWGLLGFTVETVPEPSSAFLAGMGVIGFAMLRRRKK